MIVLLFLFNNYIVAGTKLFLYCLVIHLGATNWQPEWNSKSWKSANKGCEQPLKIECRLYCSWLDLLGYAVYTALWWATGWI